MIIIKFMGGLGNQMFQYAFYKKMKSLRNDVRADFAFFDDVQKPEFELIKVFPNLKGELENGNEISKCYIKAHENRTRMKRKIQEYFPSFQLIQYERELSKFKNKYFHMKKGVLIGYWQTEMYWKDIKAELVKDFEFEAIEDLNVKNLKYIIENNNSISIHIRRGDYLTPDNYKLFGNICTIDYYRKAISYMEKMVSNPLFVIFTNDVDWAKDNFHLENALYASDYVTSEAKDWYDMCLMSCCKHHIIANSSFSWWGAYLNKNDDKIVIAPSKWLNGEDTRDIWPKEWVKI